MNQSNKHLNDIVAIARDGQPFYEQPPAKLDDSKLRPRFTRTAGVKGDIVQSLSTEIRIEGDKPTQSGTVVGDMGKIYSDIRAVLGNKDYAYVAQLEESEDRLLKAFSVALADKDTSPAALVVLNRLLPLVRECHDLMRSRKQALKNAA